MTTMSQGDIADIYGCKEKLEDIKEVIVNRKSKKHR